MLFQFMKVFFGVGFYEMLKIEFLGFFIIFDEIYVYEFNVFGIIFVMFKEFEGLKVKIMVMIVILLDFFEEFIMDIVDFREFKIFVEEVDKFICYRVYVIDGGMEFVGELIVDFGIYKKVEEILRFGLVVCNSVD